MNSCVDVLFVVVWKRFPTLEPCKKNLAAISAAHWRTSMLFITIGLIITDWTSLINLLLSQEGTLHMDTCFEPNLLLFCDLFFLVFLCFSDVILEGR